MKICIFPPAITETNHLERFRLRLQTSWFRHDLPETPTVWPMKHEIEPRPLVVSNLQLWPLQTNTPTLQGNIRLQLQLYGNKQGGHIVYVVLVALGKEGRVREGEGGGEGGRGGFSSKK